MKRFALVAAMVVAGCAPKTIDQMSYAEQKALAQDIVNRCVAAGAAMGTPDMKQCIDVEIQREHVTRQQAQARRERGRAMAAASMANTSQAYYNSAANAAAYNQSQITCRTTGGVAGQVVTRCN